MLTVNWQHIILAATGYAGTSRRIARMRAAGAQFAPPYRQGSWSRNTWMPTPAASEWAPPAYAPPFSPADPFGDRTYEFVFWSVNGSNSRETSFRMVHGGNPPPSISFGGEQWTLNAKAWYMWNRAGGPGDGGPEVEIDAFDLTSNDFIPNDFVDIEPSHAGLGPLTYTANEDGYISTEKLTEPITIKARWQFEDGHNRYEFLHWHVIRSSGSPMPEVNDSTITVHPQNSMRAYAIYDRVAADVPEPEKVEDVLRPFVLVSQANGIPLVVIPPGGGRPLVQPYGPDDLRQIVEFLHRIENDLHKLYDF